MATASLVLALIQNPWTPTNGVAGRSPAEGTSLISYLMPAFVKLSRLQGPVRINAAWPLANRSFDMS